MSERWHWRDAHAVANSLAREFHLTSALTLLHRLPLLPADTIPHLVESGAHAPFQRHLWSLERRGLIDCLHPHLGGGISTELYFLTDLGLGTLALLNGHDLRDAARRHHVYAALLRRQLPQLGQLQACYALLGGLAAAEPCQLVAWERPWRRRWYRPWAKAPAVATVPAHVTVRRQAGCSSYLLMPDVGRAPVRCHRPMLSRLLAFRASTNEPLPSLLIATPSDQRTQTWHSVVEEVCGTARETSLDARIVTWHSLAGNPCFPRSRPGLAVSTPDPPSATHPSRRAVPAGRGSRQISNCFPSPNVRCPDPGRAALELEPGDWRALDLLGRHPFLSWTEACAVEGWSVARTVERFRKLAALHLVCFLDDRSARPGRRDVEVHANPLRVPLELTGHGLTLVARHQGLSLGRAIQFNGLAGGGPERPRGNRDQLMRTLLHTLGTNQVFVTLFQTARARALVGHDDTMIEWRNAAACAHGSARPDGYGLYRRNAALYGFFVEYDRGTENLRDYLGKFNAYYQYWLTERYRRDYATLPTILVITTSYAAEERIAQAVRAATFGRPVPLPLLLTVEVLANDPENDLGFLGRIWRDPSVRHGQRRPWMQSLGI